MNKILEHLNAIYGQGVGHATSTKLQTILENYRAHIPQQTAPLTERDALLITYGDQVRQPNVPPLQSLGEFCDQHLLGIVSGIHLLPFYPFTSDDGFSVVDYRAVNPEFGTWDDVTRVGMHFRLMFDAVINHISVSSNWFRGFLHDDPRYRDYFIVVPDGIDLSRVVRPRTLPLLTEFETPSGKKNVWTTFSADQVDLNYRNPDLLLDVLDTLLFYVAHGAGFIRLDAIAFLWKEFGTMCLHLAPTHRVIQLIRAVLDAVAPHVILITETNVPHTDNMAYFGDGTNEAQMIYNFALPPLTLHTFRTGDATTLSRWASQLTLPSKRVTFFNLLASHDGIGLNPARGILGETEIDELVIQTQTHGGLVSYKTNPDGSTSPYELNISYFDALSDPSANEPLATQVDRFITAQAIMMSLVGVPGIYFHSLFGSRGWVEGVAQTGQNRTINREKLGRAMLERELNDPSSRRYQVFTRLVQLLRARAAHPAFAPTRAMQVIEGNPSVFTLLRGQADPQSILCLHNVSGTPQKVDVSGWDLFGGESSKRVDLITGILLDRSERVVLTPFQVLWLKHV